MRLIRYNIKAAFLIAVSAVILAGCGKKNENLDKAYISIKELEYQEAINQLNVALNEGEDEKLVNRALGMAYLGMSEYQAAIGYFEKALSISNGIPTKIDYDINYYLAVAYYKNKDIDSAIEIYDNILALKPKEVDALYLKGVLCAEKEEINKAKECFEKALALDSDDYDMLIKIYVILQENGYKEVGQNYMRVAMEKGSSRMSNYEKGQISFYLEDYESARTYLEKAKDEESGDGAVLLLGQTYETLGDIAYAISVYSSYVNTSIASARLYNQMGMCKMKSNDYVGALSDFQQALKTQNNDILQECRYNEIVAYEYIGDFSQARSLMESYVKAYPDDENAKREYSFLKTR